MLTTAGVRRSASSETGSGPWAWSLSTPACDSIISSAAATPTRYLHPVCALKSRALPIFPASDGPGAASAASTHPITPSGSCDPLSRQPHDPDADPDGDETARSQRLIRYPLHHLQHALEPARGQRIHQSLDHENQADRSDQFAHGCCCTGTCAGTCCAAC